MVYLQNASCNAPCQNIGYTPLGQLPAALVIITFNAGLLGLLHANNSLLTCPCKLIRDTLKTIAIVSVKAREPTLTQISLTLDQSFQVFPPGSIGDLIEGTKALFDGFCARWNNRGRRPGGTEQPDEGRRHLWRQLSTCQIASEAHQACLR